jgi:hypothetical protein
MWKFSQPVHNGRKWILAVGSTATSYRSRGRKWSQRTRTSNSSFLIRIRTTVRPEAGNLSSVEWKWGFFRPWQPYSLLFYWITNTSASPAQIVLHKIWRNYGWPSENRYTHIRKQSTTEVWSVCITTVSLSVRRAKWFLRNNILTGMSLANSAKVEPRTQNQTINLACANA